jgi:hypothetical protein
MHRLLLALLLLPLVAACGGGTTGSIGTSGTIWEETWVDGAGQPVSAKVVTSYQGAEHCDWQSATFLTLGWPLGKKMKTIDEGRQYVRDPDGVIGGWGVRDPFNDDAHLPVDARYTGYHLDENQLWVTQHEADDAVYVVRGERVERWPRTTRIIACA